MYTVPISNEQMKYLMAVLGQRPLQECYELYRHLEEIIKTPHIVTDSAVKPPQITKEK